MIINPEVNPTLDAVGYFVSPPGGAPTPYLVPPNTLLFELITGGVVYGPDNRTLRGPGWIFAHGPGNSTVSRSQPDDHYECMTARFSLGHAPRRLPWPRCFAWQDTERAETFAHEMLHAFHHSNVDRKILGDLILSRFRFQLDAFCRREERREIPPRLSEVLRYIDRHLPESLAMDELAGHVSMSASHLHARFREVLGTTPRQYIIARRLQEARHRLATTLAPIKAIAADVGYANTESFCRAFKAHFSTTAAAYRRKYMIYR